MIQDLAEKIWNHSEFQGMLRRIELEWLSREMNIPFSAEIELRIAVKALQCAAILSASDDQRHRVAAYKLATNAYQLYGSELEPLDQALNVVLTRLGNFPALRTDTSVSEAAKYLPLSLAIDEASLRKNNSIVFQKESISLTNFQHELWGDLIERRNIAVSAPTSAGKSYVLQLFIASLYTDAKPRRIVYIVPTRALISQVAEDLSEQLSRADDTDPPTIVTVPPEPDEKLPERAIFVMTQERVQLCLTMHALFKAEIIIVDEAHNIADGGRGVLLQWVIDEFLIRNASTQVLFASPLVRNLEIFQELFALDEFKAMPSVEPTVAQAFIRVDIHPGKSGRLSLFSLGDGTAEPKLLCDLELNQPLATRKDRLVQISARLGRGKLNIVYANGAAEAEKIALQLADHFSDRESSEAQLALAELIKESIHEDYGLAHCVRRGIGYHYSSIPTLIRRAVERAAAEGVIDYIVCTSTLLQGVNLPAKNIFMLAPTKGKTNPLKSMDFWNLSGRAGRLGREFQGNIFLIAYDEWKEKPLSGPKDAILVSALEQMIKEGGQELHAIINGDQSKDNPDLETAFGRLFADFQEGRLISTLKRVGLDAEEAAGLNYRIERAVSGVTTLPPQITRQTPTLSAHKQEKLYIELLDLLRRGGEAEANRLIPRHPRDGNAYYSYKEILARCHRLLLGLEGKRLHEFHALLAVWWMSGTPLPQIIQNQLDRIGESGDRSKSMRDTLELVETEIRFKTVRIFGCYAAILGQALKDAELSHLTASIPAVALYLEVGASDRTMISLMSLGLSRVAASKLNDAASDKNMGPEAARDWIAKAPLAALGLSRLLQEEVKRVVAAYAR